MTLTEKQQLRKLVQKLPPKNLDRIVEIIQRGKPTEAQSSDEILVDLEKEVNKMREHFIWILFRIANPSKNVVQDNTTLWRLYFYVEAVEKARVLAL
jgi:hypothetical protein